MKSRRFSIVVQHFKFSNLSHNKLKAKFESSIGNSNNKKKTKYYNTCIVLCHTTRQKNEYGETQSVYNLNTKQ